MSHSNANFTVPLRLEESIAGWGEDDCEFPFEETGGTDQEDDAEVDFFPPHGGDLQES